MKLASPFLISPRLLPALRIGDCWLSLEWAAPTTDGRARCYWYIDGPHGEWTGDDLASGVGGGSMQSMFAAMLSFLSAAGEAYAYQMRTGRESENADLFPPSVTEWAYQHSDEIGALAFEIEETAGLISE